MLSLECLTCDFVQRCMIKKEMWDRERESLCVCVCGSVLVHLGIDQEVAAQVVKIMNWPIGFLQKKPLQEMIPSHTYFR